LPYLAAALIRTLLGAAYLDSSVRGAGADLRDLGTAAAPPADVAALCRQVGDIPGTGLDRLLAALNPDPATTEQALRDLITQTQVQAAALPPDQR
jgi:hypothetical protein